MGPVAQQRIRRRLVETVYSTFSQWAARWDTQCHKGCASCCTREVTCSAVEADIILADLSAESRDVLLTATATGNWPAPVQTTNTFAALCLNNNDIPAKEWDRSGPRLSCPLLLDDCCTIYDSRPFSCRSFLSLQPCRATGSAVMPPIYISVTVALQQILEHISHGGVWGNMLDLLRHKLGAGPVTRLHGRPLPGYLIPPAERQEVFTLLATLFDTPIDGQHRFGDIFRTLPPMEP